METSFFTFITSFFFFFSLVTSSLICFIHWVLYIHNSIQALSDNLIIILLNAIPFPTILLSSKRIVKFILHRIIDVIISPIFSIPFRKLHTRRPTHPLQLI